MKVSDIKVGGLYTDGKQGVRRVVAEGAQFKFDDTVTDDDCVQSEVIHSAAVFSDRRGTSPAGYPLSNSTRVYFAAWAKRQLAESELQPLLDEFSARKVKLTLLQRSFMGTLAGDLEGSGINLPLSQDSAWTCSRDDLRVARSLEKKGLAAVHGALADSTFGLRLTSLGLGVMKTLNLLPAA